MKTNYIIGLVVGVVVVLGGGYYFVALPQEEDENTETTEHETENETDRADIAEAQSKPRSSEILVNDAAGTFDGSVAALIARGGEWKCAIDTKTDQTVTYGVVYVAKGKFRGNFTTDIKGFGEVMSYMISDGTTQYMWSTASPTGFKTPVSKAGALSDAGLAGQGAIDMTHSYSYVCEPWSVDMSMFTPPNTVTFTSVQ